MCDTMGFTGPGGACFAKNSDRSPNEAQVLEFRPARDNPPGKLRVTYTEIEQAPHAWAVLLSRPLWMWGAEMGLNEKGVCIGNEAVWTKGAYSKTGLTGMDLLRLALERSVSAREALDCITALLEQYGQGGDCGYDHRFYYDNSFLIMDFSSLYILETAGRSWAYRRLERGSISNTLCLGTADACGGVRDGGKTGFAKQFRDPVFSYFSGSARRQRITGECAAGASGVFDLIRGLRAHRDDAKAPLTRAGVDSPCMHAGGLIGDHTTASLAVELHRDRMIVWATGSSTPCVSLFKPWLFGSPPAVPVFPAGKTEQSAAYWRRREGFFRDIVGLTLPGDYYAERDALEGRWFEASRNAGSAAMAEIARQAAEDEEAFFAGWHKKLAGQTPRGKSRFLRYWKKKTAALDRPAKPPCTGD